MLKVSHALTAAWQWQGYDIPITAYLFLGHLPPSRTSQGCHYARADLNLSTRPRASALSGLPHWCVPDYEGSCSTILLLRYLFP